MKVERKNGKGTIGYVSVGGENWSFKGGDLLEDVCGRLWVATGNSKAVALDDGATMMKGGLFCLADGRYTITNLAD